MEDFDYTEMLQEALNDAIAVREAATRTLRLAEDRVRLAEKRFIAVKDAPTTTIVARENGLLKSGKPHAFKIGERVMFIEGLGLVGATGTVIGFIGPDYQVLVKRGDEPGSNIYTRARSIVSWTAPEHRELRKLGRLREVFYHGRTHSRQGRHAPEDEYTASETWAYNLGHASYPDKLFSELPAYMRKYGLTLPFEEVADPVADVRKHYYLLKFDSILRSGRLHPSTKMFTTAGERERFIEHITAQHSHRFTNLEKIDTEEVEHE